MNYFDSVSVEWDKKDERVERASNFAELIKSSIREKEYKTALEFGCGTGLVSFFLKEFFGKIYLLDSSEGMINVLTKKIAEKRIEHFFPSVCNLLTEDFSQPVDVIYTLMTIHHVHELSMLFSKMYKILNPGGILLIGDLEKENGSFHENNPNFDGHKGFENSELSKVLTESGFEIEKFHTFYVIKKQNAMGIEKEYPLFFCAANKYGVL